MPLPQSTPAQAQIWTVPGVADEFDRADRQAQSAKPLARLPLGENLTVETQARQTNVGGWTSKAIMATVRFGF